jgi:hypothetical protein
VFKDPSEIGIEILNSGVLPRPPSEPLLGHTAYPIAVDIDSEFAAVTFAALNIYERGWWCVASVYRRVGTAWTAFNEFDNATTDSPFERPLDAGDSWVDWMSDSGPLVYGDQVLERYAFFGIASTRTARLTVDDRELTITPWNGAFVATTPREDSVITGYAADGTLLGTI